MLARLIDTADVLIENFRPGSLSKLGFGYDAGRRPQPAPRLLLDHRLRADRPQAAPPGYDAVIQAESGLMDVTGHPDGPPTRVGVAITDYLAGSTR